MSKTFIDIVFFTKYVTRIYLTKTINISPFCSTCQILYPQKLFYFMVTDSFTFDYIFFDSYINIQDFQEFFDIRKLYYPSNKPIVKIDI